MALDPELARLVEKLNPAKPADVITLASAGAELDIEWPVEYRALMSEIGGAEGFVGESYVMLWACDQLVEINRAAQYAPEWIQPTQERPAWMAKYQWGNDATPEGEFFPGLVLFGSNGGGENLAFDRNTGAVVLVPAIGDVEDAILLGSSLTEALRRFERGDIFDDPIHPYDQPGTETTQGPIPSA